jgi:hypothetical protein
MSSLRRINSSRANGAKSRGPVTPGGKRISSGNALRHGLAAESVVLSTESRPRFEALLDSYMEKFQPRDQVEADLVEEMAVSKWRQRRSWSLETAAVDLQIDRRRNHPDEELQKTDNPTHSAIGFIDLEDKSKAVSLFARYETRMRRTYQRALSDLDRVSKIRILQNEPTSDFEHPDPEADPGS